MQRVLLVDDDSDLLSSLQRGLSSAGVPFPVDCAASVPAAHAIIGQREYAVVVSDLSVDPAIGAKSGLDFIEGLHAVDSTLQIIVLTGHGGTASGVESLRRGAVSFLEKPADLSHLAALILNGARQAKLLRQLRDAERSDAESDSFGLVGSSLAVRRLREDLRFLAETPVPVLISGETGVGKGFCARLVHDRGPRRGAAFVRYQPSITSSDLAASDLFGHLRGAFTGATESRGGLLAEADGGTLFLDEVDELSPEVQVALLGVLQERRFRVLGSSREVGADFRLICATNRDPDVCVRSGRLRADLFHRVAHARLHISPLRERVEDIPLLSQAVIERVARDHDLNVRAITGGCIDALVRHLWPGNIRELEAVLQLACFKASFLGVSAIDVTHLALGPQPSVAETGNGGGFHEMVEIYKRKLVADAVARHSGNQSMAARALRMDRSQLRRLL